MDRRRNMLIGIVAGIVMVAALTYATGVTKLLLSPFRSSSSAYKSSEAATAPELATGNWINSEPLDLKDLHGRPIPNGLTIGASLHYFCLVIITLAFEDRIFTSQRKVHL